MSNEERGGRLWLCNHVNFRSNENEKKKNVFLCVICEGWIDAIRGNIQYNLASI